MREACNLLVFGYFGFANTGDEAILAALLADLRQRLPNLHMTVTSGDPSRTESLHEVRAVRWNDIPRLIGAADEADAILVGGGGLLHDYWPFDSRALLSSTYSGISFFATSALLADAMSKPFVVCGIGVGPLHGEAARDHTRMIFERAQRATVRDAVSRRILGELGLDLAKIDLSADAAFRLEPPAVRDIRRWLPARSKLDQGRTPLGVILRQWDVTADPRRWEKEVARALDRLSSQLPVQPVFVPFQTLDEYLSDDRVVAARVAAQMSRGRHVIIAEAPSSPVETVALLGSCSLVLTMRLHGAILAAKAGVPTVGLAYDPKVSHVMTALGCERYVLDLRELDADILADALGSAWTERASLRRSLKEAAQKLANRAEGNVRAVLETLELPRPTETPSASLLRSLRLTMLQRAHAAACHEDPTRTHERLAMQLSVLTAQRDFYRLEMEDARRAREVGEQALNQAKASLLTVEQELERVSGILDSMARTPWMRVARVFWKIRGWGGRLARRSLARFTRKIPTVVARRSFYSLAHYRHRMGREPYFSTDLSDVKCPCEEALVSVVLPVYNGLPLLTEALDSILSQTYPSLEVIAIDDGSTDGTGELLDEYARRDPRVRVVHQDNRTLPRALSRGFRLAKGTYLTWTSHDNRLRRDFVEQMVACLDRHPSWDMVYANMDLIGEDGSFLKDSSWYTTYQHPPGSEHVHLPHDVSELNTWPNNYVGAAFMYRARTAWLIGDYSRIRFTSEDYDYWMRINEFLTLRHADFDDPVYEYRFHPGALTARDDELEITRRRESLMVFDDFRRDFSTTSLLWCFADRLGNAVELQASLSERAYEAGHKEVSVAELCAMRPPRRFSACAYVRTVTEPGCVDSPPDHLPECAFRALIVTGSGDLPADVPDGWDLCCVTSQPAAGRLPRVRGGYRGWLAIESVDSLFTVLDLRTRLRQFRMLEDEIADGRRSTDDRRKRPRISVIVCSYERTEQLPRAVKSVACQTLDHSDYELVIVDNNPADGSLLTQIKELQKRFFLDLPCRFRYVACPYEGLSHARNAGISEASGDILCFIDDDAVAHEDLLRRLLRTFEMYPRAGVVGGHIELEPPKPRPHVLHDGWERYWSHFVTGYDAPTEVENWWEFPWGANWSARREALLQVGGFRTRYGRRGGDFSGGEELVAASLIQRVGWKILIDPDAKVRHEVSRERYTYRHVKRTIIAGALVNYTAQRDLYLPKEASVRRTVRQLLDPRIDSTVVPGTLAARARHWYYRREALVRLLLMQLRELPARFARQTDSRRRLDG